MRVEAVGGQGAALPEIVAYGMIAVMSGGLWLVVAVGVSAMW